jgi:hypothetical protein
MKSLTLKEAERITSWYRSQFSDRGTDIEFVSRCHRVIKSGAFSMIAVGILPLLGFYRGRCSLDGAIFCLIICFAFAVLFLIGTRQLARVLAFMEMHSCQNLSEMSKLSNDRNA